jgi:hypothetical protein
MALNLVRREGSSDEQAILHRMCAFVKEEDMLSAESVASFVRVFGKGAIVPKGTPDQFAAFTEQPSSAMAATSQAKPPEAKLSQKSPVSKLTAEQEWANDPALQKDFPNPGSYAAYARANSQGKVRIASRASDLIAPASSGHGSFESQAPTADDYKAEWAASAELQREFPSGDLYSHYKQAEAKGQFRILQRRS